MLGLGTLFNAVGVVAGGLLGLTIGHVLSSRFSILNGALNVLGNGSKK